VQLILQLVGARKAIRDGIPYDAPIGRGKPEEVARDMWGWERITRESFWRPDRETTPLIASGLALSVAMALLGLGRKGR
jgi:hypothetical protein